MKFRFEISLRNLIEQYNPLRDDNNLQVKTKKEVRVYLRHYVAPAQNKSLK